MAFDSSVGTQTIHQYQIVAILEGLNPTRLAAGNYSVTVLHEMQPGQAFPISINGNEFVLKWPEIPTLCRHFILTIIVKSP